MGTTGLRAEFQVEIHSSFSFSMGFGKSLWHGGAFRRAPWGVRGAQRGVCGVTGRGQGWVAVGETLPPLGGTSAVWPGPAPSPRTAAGDLGTVPWGMLWDGAQRTGSCSLALSTPPKTDLFWVFGGNASLPQKASAGLDDTQCPVEVLFP